MTVSYTIRYGKELPGKRPAGSGGYGAVAAVLVIMGIMAAGGFLLKEEAREAMAPGTGIREAISGFSADIRDGMSFREAFGEFCCEILEEAKDTA